MLMNRVIAIILVASVTAEQYVSCDRFTPYETL